MHNHFCGHFLKLKYSLLTERHISSILLQHFYNYFQCAYLVKHSILIFSQLISLLSSFLLHWLSTEILCLLIYLFSNLTNKSHLCTAVLKTTMQKQLVKIIHIILILIHLDTSSGLKQDACLCAWLKYTI